VHGIADCGCKLLQSPNRHLSGRAGRCCTDRSDPPRGTLLMTPPIARDRMLPAKLVPRTGGAKLRLKLGGGGTTCWGSDDVDRLDCVRNGVMHTDVAAVDELALVPLESELASESKGSKILREIAAGKLHEFLGRQA